MLERSDMKMLAILAKQKRTKFHRHREYLNAKDFEDLLGLYTNSIFPAIRRLQDLKLIHVEQVRKHSENQVTITELGMQVAKHIDMIQKCEQKIEKLLHGTAN